MREGFLKQIQELMAAEAEYEPDEKKRFYPAFYANGLAIQTNIEFYRDELYRYETFNSDITVKLLTFFQTNLESSLIGLDRILAQEAPKQARHQITQKFADEVKKHIAELVQTIAIIKTEKENTNQQKTIENLDDFAEKDFINAWIVFNDPNKAEQISLFQFNKIVALFYDVGFGSIYGFHLARMMCIELEKRILATVAAKDKATLDSILKKGLFPADYYQELTRRAAKGALQYQLVVSEQLGHDKKTNTDFKLVDIDLKLDDKLQKSLDVFFQFVNKHFPTLFQEYNHVIRKWLILGDVSRVCSEYQAKITALTADLNNARTRIAEFQKIVALINPASRTPFLESNVPNNHVQRIFPAFKIPELLKALADHDRVEADFERATHLLQQLDLNAKNLPDSPDAIAWILAKKHHGECHGNNHVLVNDIFQATRSYAVVTFVSTIGRTFFGRFLPPPAHYAEKVEDVALALNQH